MSGPAPGVTRPEKVAAPIAVKRGANRIRPDPRRVIAKLFVPGQEGLIEGESRAESVIDRIMALDDDQARATLAEVVALFADRHDELHTMLEEHFALVSHRVDDPLGLSATRRQLIGAYFTQEYAVEAAAVCNPSMVAHPDQGGLRSGETRFVMSVRAVGEGHRSSIELRTGVIGADAEIYVDEPLTPVISGQLTSGRYARDQFHRILGDEGPSAALVLGLLPDHFTSHELDAAIEELRLRRTNRFEVAQTLDRIEAIAANNYEVTFPATSSISQRVLSPIAPTESHGMEDARFVRFTDDDGSVVYYATYTAYDGVSIAVQLLATVDFLTFTSSQLSGRAATNKGMALFPRRIAGRFAALSRWDRTSNSLVTSDDVSFWDEPVPLRRPGEPWDLIQLGNCGSPLETTAGWLVLTHGVGPMRRYVIGADLLDLEDPSRVIGSLREPLIVPEESERDGYVPNVVYSCGAMVHGDDIVIPYGIGDANICMATVSLGQLLERLT